jgi:hypothetical protein
MPGSRGQRVLDALLKKFPVIRQTTGGGQAAKLPNLKPSRDDYEDRDGANSDADVFFDRRLRVLFANPHALQIVRHATMGDWFTPEGLTLNAQHVRTATDHIASEIVAFRGRPGTEAAQSALRRLNAALRTAAADGVLVMVDAAGGQWEDIGIADAGQAKELYRYYGDAIIQNRTGGNLGISPHQP